MQTTTRLAEYLCEMCYADIDDSVTVRAKDICLSALGAALAGSRMEVSSTLAAYAKNMHAAQEAGVIGAGFSTSVELAALVNCSASHCTELEDVAFPEAVYTCHIVPTMFALGEKLKAPGRRVLEAVIIGYEITARPAITSRAFSRGWQATAHFGTIGAAAGASKLLGLDARQSRNAISIAASFAGGLVRQTGTAAHVIEAGMAGRNGVFAATLAQRGLAGNPTIMEGKAGYWDALAYEPELDFELGKGADFRIGQVGLKAYPCCYFLQRIIEGAIELVARHNIAAADVESVEVHTNALFQRIVPHENPRDGEEARFSMPHAVAAALAREEMFIETFTLAKVNDPTLVALRRKIKMLPHPDWNGPVMASDNPLTIRMKNGREYRKSCVTHHGDPRDPLSQAEVIARFERCARGVIAPADIAEIAERVYRLETLTDVCRISELLTCAPGNGVHGRQFMQSPALS